MQEPDDKDAEITRLKAEVTRLTNLNAAQDEALREYAKPKPSKFSGVGKFFGRIGKGIAAAFSTPEAVRAEKSLATIVATRLLLASGASYGTVELAKALLKALGVTT